MRMVVLLLWSALVGSLVMGFLTGVVEAFGRGELAGLLGCATGFVVSCWAFVAGVRAVDGGEW